MQATTKQQQIEQLESRIERIKARIEELRSKRDAFPRESKEWLSWDSYIFEAYCDLRQAQEEKRLAGRKWACDQCGSIFGPKWVAFNGYQCDVECGGHLEEK